MEKQLSYKALIFTKALQITYRDVKQICMQGHLLKLYMMIPNRTGATLLKIQQFNMFHMDGLTT